ncbi:zinc-dependent alcohol dehydrogenase [Bacillus sp. OxB-1]|uniref:zinc-dependent alcohol dehydrogenase n=1 Tax=Bacillus sp. (strain OxB-1) TaxID=98228 RepID=UPI000597B46D|nr:alcohol dehydrogenase catalytic domain-containing protein [Bacillus sp. OxB-1]
MLELFIEKPLHLELRENSETRSLKDDEVRIKVKYGGICGSDLSVYKGKFSHAVYPIRPGHELVGTIVEKGKYSPYEEGTRVVVLPNTFCSECEMCKQGKTNICVNKKAVGINQEGGFAEEFIISSRFVWPIPDDLSDDRAILIEPFAVVVSGLNKVKISEGMSVAVVGTGAIGLLAASLAYSFGANVTGIDVNTKKHQLVREIGNIRAVYPNDIKDEKFDIVIEAAGTEEAVIQSIQILKPGGSMVALGITGDVKIPYIQVVRNDLTIYGSIIYKFPQDYEKTIEYLRNPSVNVDSIVSKIVSLQEYQTAFQDALSGNFGKILIDFNIK